MENEGMNILHSQVYRDNGTYRRKTYVKGHYPDIGGQLVEGWSGPETLIDRPTVIPIVVFDVKLPEQEEEDEFEFQYNPARNLP